MMSVRWRWSIGRLVLVAMFVAVCVTASCVSAWASGGVDPGWEAAVNSDPTNLPPGGSGLIEIHIYNVGAEASHGTVTLTDKLPPGLVPTEAYGLESFGERNPRGWGCSVLKTSNTVTCTTSESVPSGQAIGSDEQPDRVVVKVMAEPGASRTETNQVTLTGGGALSSTSVATPVVVSSAVPPFGFAGFDGWATNADGTIDTQAGSHPYNFIIRFAMNDYANNPFKERDLDVNVPAGIVGDPNAVPQCPRYLFDRYECPATTQIGVDIPDVSTNIEKENLGGKSKSSIFAPPINTPIPLYNLVPPKGIPAQFAFTILGIQTFLDAGVRTGNDNGITEHVNNIIEEDDIAGNTTILWGRPAEAGHNPERCAPSGGPQCYGGASSNAELRPFLTLPSSCGAPPRYWIETNSWEEPGTIAKDEFLMHDDNGTPIGFTGCERLVHFAPLVSIAPDTSFSDTPAGLSVEVRIPPDSNPEGLGTAGLKDTTVALPEGVVINPGQATGLQACSPAEENRGGSESQREEEEGPVSCPVASKVGTDEIETPLLKEKLQGNVYILGSEPPNLQLLVAASAAGVNLKLVGSVHLNETTGQLVTTFEKTPDLPFTTFKLNFSGGAQAALATPTNCGVYGSEAVFTPWSSPFIPNESLTSSFQITNGPGGGACPSSPLPFAPSMLAGSTTDQAGGFTDFSLLLQAPDANQRISRLQFKAPPGLLGMISQIGLCEEPQASQGTCPASSQIGHNIDAAGPGPYPFVVPEAGQPESPIYLTGPYDGAPFGLSIVVPAVAGPFNLGTVVVRAKIEVDPLTAQITVTTDPLPQILKGVPLDLRTIDAVIDRPGFMFNPTNCSPQSFSGTATGAQGATAPLSSHFQMGSCQSLKFDPNFKVSATGKTSRKEGAGLNVKILYPLGVLPDNQATSQANVGQVKVDLPKQLPSRLTTLQKACTTAQFETNPAGCPPASKVGEASAITPLLPVPVAGPAYFVSYGGAKFPELVIVLQGDGVTVDLHGETFINKAGITSSTFRYIPDVPITSFELNLPQGPFSALAANGNICNSKLVMPTAFTGHNNAAIHENTNISVTGCPKTKKTTKPEKAKKTKKPKKGGRTGNTSASNVHAGNGGSR